MALLFERFDRPMLLLLAAGAFGYRGRKHHELAAVVEFIHTATLLHDDVVDESALRRGRPTANALFGNAAAVLVGDFVYSRAFEMMVGVDSMRVLQVLAEATNVIAEGEVMQLMNCHNPDIDEAGYLEVVRCKTAKLFEAATRLGAILGAAPREQEQAIAAYGTRLGTAFQLIDDVLDYSARQAELGKTIGDDFREGKITLPVILAFRRGDETERAFWRRAVEDLEQRDADLERAIARDALGIFPESAEKRAMLEAIDFAIVRAH